MLRVAGVLFKLFVAQFYKHNIGFFFFWFIFFFGIVPSNLLVAYHQNLMVSIISSPIVLGIVSVGWLLYNFRCLRYYQSTILKYQNSMLCELQLLSAWQLFLLLTIAHGIAFFPVGVYIAVVTVLAISKANFMVAVFLFAFLLSVFCGSFIVLKNSVLNSVGSQESFFSKITFNDKKTVNYSFYLVHYMVYEQKIKLLILKVFSFLFFYLFFIKLIDGFHKNWFMVALFLIGFSHAILVFKIHQFTEERLGHVRGLPLSMLKRISIFLIAIGLVLIPELIFMLQAGLSVLSVMDVVIFYLMLLAQLMFYLSTLYFSNTTLKQYIQSLFWMVVISCFLSIVLSPIVLIVGQFIFCYVLFKTKYFQYEHIVQSN